MPIPVACECGRSFKAKDELAGKKAGCPSCQAILQISKREVTADIEDEASNLLLATTPETESSRPSRQAYSPPDEDGFRQAGSASLPPVPFKKPAPSAEPKAAKKKTRAKRSGGGIAINGEIITGLLMMGGAALWFFVALANGVLFFYPPVLFILGIGTVIRGFTGRD